MTSLVNVKTKYVQNNYFRIVVGKQLVGTKIEYMS